MEHFNSGITGCGKSTFDQNLEKNKMLGEIKEAISVLKIPLSKDRENNIGECFVDEEIDFKYPNKDEFDDLLGYFQRQKPPHNENFLGENITLDRLLWTMSRILLTNQKYLLIC